MKMVLSSPSIGCVVSSVFFSSFLDIFIYPKGMHCIERVYICDKGGCVCVGWWWGHDWEPSGGEEKWVGGERERERPAVGAQQPSPGATGAGDGPVDRELLSSEHSAQVCFFPEFSVCFSNLFLPGQDHVLDSSTHIDSLSHWIRRRRRRKTRLYFSRRENIKREKMDAVLEQPLVDYLNHCAGDADETSMDALPNLWENNSFDSVSHSSFWHIRHCSWMYESKRPEWPCTHALTLNDVAVQGHVRERSWKSWTKRKNRFDEMLMFKFTGHSLGPAAALTTNINLNKEHDLATETS